MKHIQQPMMMIQDDIDEIKTMRIIQVGVDEIKIHSSDEHRHPETFSSLLLQGEVMHNCKRALINASRILFMMIILFNHPYHICHFQLSFSFRINFKAKLFRSTFFRSFSLLHFFTEGRGTNNCKCALMKALPLQLSYCWTPNHTLIPKVPFFPRSIHKRIHGHILRDSPFQFGKA